MTVDLSQQVDQLRLADDALSTDCYSVRLLLEFLQLPYQSVYADIEQPATSFQYPALLNPPSIHWGMQPIFETVLELTGTRQRWMPEHLQLEIEDWFDFNTQLKSSLGRLRQAHLAADQFLPDEELRVQQAQDLLLELEDYLCEQQVRRQDYLLGQQPTLADLVVFPLVALAWDAGVSLVPFLHIRRWINHMRHQPHFIPMAGLLAVN